MCGESPASSVVKESKKKEKEKEKDLKGAISLQRVRSLSLALAAIALCTTTPSFAQSVSYLDNNYRPASPKSYAYKRVITYKSPIVIEHITRDLRYGNWVAYSTPTALHNCSDIIGQRSHYVRE